MRRILHRYLLREITGPFFTILGVFLFVLLMGRILKIVEMIVRHGVSPWDILKMLAYLVPSFLPLAIPMATLMAGVVCFSRLSGDQEITALKASGIGLHQLLPPVAVFSFATFLVSLILNLEGAPWGAYAFRQLVFNLAKKHVSVGLREGVFNEIFPGFVMYTEHMKIDEGLMEGIFINDQRRPEVPLQILAKRGTLGRGPSGAQILTFRLENGNIFQTSTKEAKVRRIHFERYEINLDLAAMKPEERLVGKREADVGFFSLIERIKYRHSKGKSARNFIMEIHRRLALSVACLVFGFLSLPVSVQSRPKGRSHGFLLGTMVILVYYLLFSASETLAETERLAAGIAMWGPDLIFGLYTVVLMVRTEKERPSALLAAANGILDLGQRWAGRFLGAGR
jgi:lipopolysaccharide export system permease protein